MKSKDGILRVGGIGTGRIFQWAHIRSYPRILHKARLVGFYDLNKARAEQALEKARTVLQEYTEEHPEAADAVKENISELEVHDSLESLFEQVDVVDIATHARGRMPSAIAAFEHGVHAMAEKPMARTWTETDRAARRLAASKGVLFQLNDDNVFEPKYRTLSDLISQGIIGKPQSMTLVRGSALDGKTVLKAQANAMENGGGCLLDYGSHGMAGTWSVIGRNYRPVLVDAVSIDVLYRHRVLEDEPYIMEVDDNARVKVLFQDPDTGSWLTVYIEATWCGAHIGLAREDRRFQIQIVGDQGVIESTRGPHITVRHYNGGVTELPLREFAGESISMCDEIETFIDHIYANTAPELDIHFGGDIIAICGAAYLSAIRKKAVSLEEFKEYSRGFVKKHGDTAKADDAIVAELLAPYKYGP